MSKKIVFSSILGLLVLFLVGMFVFSDIGVPTIAPLTTAKGANSTLLPGNTNIVLNITVGITSPYRTNITAFNITLTNDLIFKGYISNGGIATSWSEDGNYNHSSWTIQNATWIGGFNALWSCFNSTATTIHCNTSATGNPLSQYGNTSITLRLNVTTANLATETQLLGFNITTYTNATGVKSYANFSLLNVTYVDGLAPRIVALNITDGNFSIINGTNYGLNTVVNLGSITGGTRLGTTSPLTITATITDLAIEANSLKLFYNTTTSPYIPRGLNATIVTATLASMSSGGSGTYTWTIPAASLVNGNTLNFWIQANDTTNHQVNLTAFGKAYTAFNLTINSTIPKILKWNMTDGTNWVSNGNGHLSPNKGYTVYVDVSGLPKGSFTALSNRSNTDFVTIFYGNNTGSKAVWNETLSVATLTGHSLYALNLTNLSIFTPYGTNTWKGIIPAGFVNNSQILSFVIRVDSDVTVFNYTASARGVSNLGYNVTADGTSPSVTLTTTDLDSTIDTDSPITYNCAAVDSTWGAGAITYKFVLDKPGEANAVITSYSTASSYTFTGTQTNRAGTNTVYCYAKDAVGNEGSATKTFSAQYSSGSSGSGSGGSGGGGSGGTTTIVPTGKVDVDFSKPTSQPTAKVSVTEGASKKFTLDGKVEHKLTVNKVTATKVTITLMSTPITLELEPGQVELVDLDADGTKDVKVTLNKINAENAEITLEKLVPTKPAPTTPATTTPSTSSETVGGTTPESQESGSSWIWWIVGIVVVVGLVYLIFFKKR